MLAEHLMARLRQGRGILRHARTIRRLLLEVRLPAVAPFWAAIHLAVTLVTGLGHAALRVLYRDPVFRSRCRSAGRRLRLEGSMPQLFGGGTIVVGDDVGIGDRNTWVVGFKVSEDATLVIGSRVTIGYQTTFSIVKCLTIGDDTMIAGNVQIYDNPSHPIAPARRLRHEAISLDEAEPVVIGKNVWLGNRCTVLRGVTIGDNSIVATSAVVTRSVPPNTLVAGNPARVIRSIADPTGA